MDVGIKSVGFDKNFLEDNLGEMWMGAVGVGWNSISRIGVEYTVAFVETSMPPA